MKQTFLLLVATLYLSACTPQPPQKMVTQPEQSSTESSSPTASPSTLPMATGKPKSTVIPTQVTGRATVTQLPSSFHSDEPRNTKTVDTIIIHSLYNPKYPTELTIARAKQVLDENEVSSHYIIARDGKIYQLVQENYQAWHAGVSRMPSPDSRSGVNAFSIGIELIATEESGITQAQYESLTSLVINVSEKLPIKNILGHGDIAPGRKTDPWKFEWTTWQNDLKTKSSKTFTFYH